VIQQTLNQAVSAFGVATKAKLSNAAVTGQPEDQLRGPLEDLVRGLALFAGLPENAVALIGESSLSSLGVRPDYAVSVQNALVGFIEVKAPGKGADPRYFTGAHDKAQWKKLQSLPNLIYTDGNAFSLWRDGKLDGQIIHLVGDVASSGAKLESPPSLLALASDFLTWTPITPKSPKQLAETCARLCRLLRDEVTEQLDQGNVGLTDLASEWRHLLFPQADNAQFADGYAQAVTFGLLVARARNISLSEGIGAAALELRQSNSLIATALRLLTDAPENQEALKTSLQTLTRVLEAVEWAVISKGNADAWLYFYEDFLNVYDKALRKKTGSYYTPPEVVEAMVRLTDEALRDPTLFAKPLGLADPNVTIADPAVGTGTFLLGVLRRIAATVAEDQGEGAVPAAISAAANRLIGFELQFGPFAVAQLRILAEVQSLMDQGFGNGSNLPALRLFVTDTLGNPYAEQAAFSGMVAPIGDSRRQANAIKRSEAITVVIGNPPYKVDAGGQGGWIEAGDAAFPPAMALWTPPVEWGLGSHTKHLKNLYVFFWRWATWKVFGSGHEKITNEPKTDRSGLVCFITASGFLNGPGFQKMREELRRDCSHLWIIDCSPEGFQPAVATRVFEGVQQEICIVIGLRQKGKNLDTAASVRYRSLPLGNRKDKFAALSAISLFDADWISGETQWREPLLPPREGAWADFVPLMNMFSWYSPGVKTHRTWVIAPDSVTLERRWDVLKAEKDPDRKADLFHGDDARNPNTVVRDGLWPHLANITPLALEKGKVLSPERFAFRTLDRQWMSPDNRLISRARPKLWAMQSENQIFLTAFDAHSPTSGPAVSFTELIPDGHHYKGSFGGRVLPLWRDATATTANLPTELVSAISQRLGQDSSPANIFAYIAGVLANPAYTSRFAKDLARPGLRVPISAEPDLFMQAVSLGEEIIWLHTYGERFADPAKLRPAGPPRMSKGEGPTIPAVGALPGANDPLPATMTYDAPTCRLHIGEGYIDNVPPAVWAYEVSGRNVLRSWFSYRKLDRTRPIIGERRPPSPLEKIQPDHWLPEYTTDLLNLLHVLGRLVRLEPLQSILLDQICNGPLITQTELIEAGAVATEGAKTSVKSTVAANQLNFL
jgi:Type ISP C-terminal specificity domain/N-6 DNA Methylase